MNFGSGFKEQKVGSIFVFALALDVELVRMLVVEEGDSVRMFALEEEDSVRTEDELVRIEDDPVGIVLAGWAGGLLAL